MFPACMIDGRMVTMLHLHNYADYCTAHLRTTRTCSRRTYELQVMMRARWRNAFHDDHIVSQPPARACRQHAASHAPSSVSRSPSRLPNHPQSMHCHAAPLRRRVTCTRDTRTYVYAGLPTHWPCPPCRVSLYGTAPSRQCSPHTHYALAPACHAHAAHARLPPLLPNMYPAMPVLPCRACLRKAATAMQVARQTRGLLLPLGRRRRCPRAAQRPWGAGAPYVPASALPAAPRAAGT